MAGKSGLLAEREFLTRTWRDDGHFAIMHDLTSCLRIGDASVFMPGFVRLEEIKTNNEHRTAAQKNRIQRGPVQQLADGDGTGASQDRHAVPHPP
jgi:hypothetical protein